VIYYKIDKLINNKQYNLLNYIVYNICNVVQKVDNLLIKHFIN